MRKGILSTILVIQLILLVLVTFSSIQSKREIFVVENQYQRLSAYKMASSFYDIKYDMHYLREKNATSETIDNYLSFVNQTYKENYFLDIYINKDYLKLVDSSLEMQKEGDI